jgi:hypothetical protein
MNMLSVGSILLAATALVVHRGEALEIDVGAQGGGLAVPPSGWSMHVGADRLVTVEFFPAAHLSRQFILSRDQFAQLQALVAHEDFFSLPQSVGSRIPDGPWANIRIQDGSKDRSVRLQWLPYELRPIWRTDVSPIGRAFRLCEHLRSLLGVPEAMHCPGVPSGKEEAGAPRDAPPPNNAYLDSSVKRKK